MCVYFCVLTVCMFVRVFVLFVDVYYVCVCWFDLGCVNSCSVYLLMGVGVFLCVLLICLFCLCLFVCVLSFLIFLVFVFCVFICLYV